MPAFVPIVESLGFGSQVVIAASLVLVALYILRVVRLGGALVGLLGTAATIGMVVLVVLAVAIAFGWVSPNPRAFFGHMAGVFRFLVEHGVDAVRRALEMLWRVVGG